MSQRMKKISALMMALAMVFALASCGSSSNKDTADEGNTADVLAASDTTDEAQPAQLSGTVSTNGSTSMEKVVSALIESFNETYPDVTVTYDATGSGTGINAVSEGTCDIGLSSRNLKEEETGLTGTVVALDGIAIITNTDNAIADLSVEQIAGLFNGTVTNWSEVGGRDAPVVVIGREAGSGTRDGFESIVGVEDACAYDQELTSTGAVIAAVAANENAIGYASLASVTDEVNAVTVDGVECSEATILDGTYSIQRPFLMVTNDSSELSPAAQAFLDYAASADVEEIIAAAGAVQPQ